MDSTPDAPAADKVSFYISGIKVNAVFTQKSGNTVDRVKQILANSFAMKMSQQENNVNIR